MLRRVTKFPAKQVKDIALKVLRRNACFAHPDHVTIAMLGDENKPVRDIAVDKICFYVKHSLLATLTPLKKQAARK